MDEYDFIWLLELNVTAKVYIRRYGGSLSGLFPALTIKLQ